MGEGEKSRAAGDGGGNHGYKDGGQGEQQDDIVQEEDGLPAVDAVVQGLVCQPTPQRKSSKVCLQKNPGMSSRINVHSTDKKRRQ